VQAQYRANNLFNQLTMQTDFTWSKTLDNTSEIFATGGAGNTLFASQNPFNTAGAEYSTSGIDFPRVWTILFDEQLPFYKDQRGAWGHLLGGWHFSANYIVASGQTFTPVQELEEALSTATGNYYDSAFVNAFVGTDTARPFFGSSSAPANSVGIFAGDACLLFTKSACALTPTQLISYNALNSTNTPIYAGGGCSTCIQTIQQNQVRFIFNARTAQAVFGTPFGNVPRNPLRDAISNIGNASIYKMIKIGERANFEMHMTALNVLNHYNFANVDVALEDAGLNLFPGTGFNNPALSTAAGRTLYVGGKFTF
jgi:hypothetical protein